MDCKIFYRDVPDKMAASNKFSLTLGRGAYFSFHVTYLIILTGLAVYKLTTFLAARGEQHLKIMFTISAAIKLKITIRNTCFIPKIVATTEKTYI